MSADQAIFIFFEKIERRDIATELEKGGWWSTETMWTKLDDIYQGGYISKVRLPHKKLPPKKKADLFIKHLEDVFNAMMEDKQELLEIAVDEFRPEVNTPHNFDTYYGKLLVRDFEHTLKRAGFQGKNEIGHMIQYIDHNPVLFTQQANKELRCSIRAYFTFKAKEAELLEWEKKAAMCCPLSDLPAEQSEQYIGYTIIPKPA